MSDVSDPGQSLVATLLYNLQISNLTPQTSIESLITLLYVDVDLYSRGGEVRDLELDFDGWPAFSLL